MMLHLFNTFHFLLYKFQTSDLKIAVPVRQIPLKQCCFSNLTKPELKSNVIKIFLAYLKEAWQTNKVCFIFSYLAPLKEMKAAAILNKFPSSIYIFPRATELMSNFKNFFEILCKNLDPITRATK